MEPRSHAQTHQATANSNNVVAHKKFNENGVHTNKRKNNKENTTDKSILLLDSFNELVLIKREKKTV